MEGFAQYLQRVLQMPLPGEQAHRRMMPRYLNGRRRVFVPTANSRHTAIAVVLTYGECVLLTLRSQNLRTHRGQISCPGGHIEEGEIPEHTALRELSEEVGITPECVTVLGILSSVYTAPSDAVIVPVVFWWNGKGQICLQQEEVDEAFTVPLKELLDSVIEDVWQLPYGTMIVPHWRIHSRVPLWGATAMVLSELLWLYEQWLTAQTARVK